jgi:glycogen(starch) synthase
MRILHLLDHSTPRHSAYTQRTMAILREQRALGWHTSQLTGPRQGPVEADRNRDGWHFFRTAPAGGALERVPLFGAVSLIARRLRKVAQLTRPDLLHAHSPAENALAALGVGRRLGLPVVFEVHAGWGEPESGLRRQLARAVETYAARRADAVTTSSEGLRAQLEAGGVRRARLTVVPNAVDLRRFPAAQPRDAALALRLGLGNSVVFAGHAALERSAALHALIDVLVFPRLPLRQAELVPDGGLLEAMARGCLVAASNVGSHRELVEHGRTGILFEAGKHDALADAIEVLLAAPASWPALRGAARWFVEYQRSWDVSVGRYVPLYQRLLARRRRR